MPCSRSSLYRPGSYGEVKGWVHVDSHVQSWLDLFPQQMTKTLNLGVWRHKSCGWKIPTHILLILYSDIQKHTQSRPDRDDYIEIKWDNIQVWNFLTNYYHWDFFSKERSTILTWPILTLILLLIRLTTICL